MRPVEIGLTALIAAVTEEEPRVLVVPHPETGELALPSGPLDPESDRTLELALRRWVQERTGVELGYVEQLYTFGNRYRNPRERRGGPRVVSIAYLALVREVPVAGDGGWRGWYEFLPWEDWRRGRPRGLERTLVPALERWTGAAEGRPAVQQRRDRIAIGFGLEGAPWNPERVLDRYELLYEAGLVGEAWRVGGGRGETSASEAVSALADPGTRVGEPLALDHRRILASALGRLRGKLRYRPVVFEMMPRTFTLLALQRTVEALAGAKLHKQNFRRLIEAGGLVEGTGKRVGSTGGRPAELFRFRREVLRERPAPGVGVPRIRR
ncbi:MAG TPA: hypothetical protein VI942_11885 [Thermoanaerobaculia bacterium]|nr:hypothetical protein [Thermoanaerobaculia bacterium]